MGQQNSTSQGSNKSSTGADQDALRKAEQNRSGAKGGAKSRDAGTVAHSDDDVADDEAREGTREDAAGSKSRSSK